MISWGVIRVALGTGLALLLFQSAPAAVLVHRYTFETNANDVIGGAHGVVMGGATFTGTGELTLDGANDFVDLPDGIISSLEEISVEAWITWQRGSTPAWQRIFDFGSSAANQGKSYFLLTPATASDFTAGPDWVRATISTNNKSAETPWLDMRSPMPTNVETHVAVTYSPARGIAKLYLNGTPVAVGVATIPLSTINDTNNWLGRSQFINDPYFKGRFNEFRIHHGLLLDSEVAASFATGPDSLNSASGTQVSTLLAEGITPDSATLNALVRPDNLPAAVFFEYGRTTNYGMTTPATDTGGGTAPVSIARPIASLTSGAIYHFRCVATNSAGTNYGGDTLFITAAVIRNFGMTTNGQFQVLFDAAAGTRYFFEQSTTATRPSPWSSLTSAVLVADGLCQFTDNNATNFPMRFYRLMLRDW